MLTVLELKKKLNKKEMGKISNITVLTLHLKKVKKEQTKQGSQLVQAKK